ncbi:reverse transcriptase domain-containing protein [Tanacetum coccineum]
MSMSMSASCNQTDLLLNQLELGATCTIVVMICRIWDVNATTGQYLSTDFIVSDIEGNLMHCTARGNIAHNFLRLKEGAIYSVKNFSVQPNKDEFRVMKFVDFMVEFDGDTTIRKSSMKSKGFNHYPFQLVEIDDLEPTNNKFLVDVAGYVTNVGRSTQQRTCSKTLDFYLANRRLYRLYLSIISSTLIVEDEKIHVLTQLKTDDSGVELTKEIMSRDNTAPKPRTLENLLMWARNQKYDSSTFYCEVKIEKFRTKKVEYPVIKLELEIYDDTAEVVVVMFDEMETSLVKCSAGSIVVSKDQDEEEHSGLPPTLANIMGTSHTLELKPHTYYELGNYESFAYSKVVIDEVVKGSASSDVVAAKAGSKAPVLKRLSKSLSVATPSQPSKEKK